MQIPRFFLHKLELYASYTSLSGQLYTNRAPSIGRYMYTPSIITINIDKIIPCVTLHYFLQQTLAWKDIKHTNESDSVVE